MSNLENKALNAYTYFFPLVFNIQQIKRYAEIGVEGTGGAGFNAFSHASRLADATSDFVSVNNDTIYSLAAINLTGGPLKLSLPESPDKYYVGQLIDAWSNNFAYVGTRGTGGKAIELYLIPPGFTGELPENLQTIEFPTNIGVITTRYAIDGPDDLPNVQKLQEEMTLTAVYPEQEITPVPEGTGPKELAFFNEAVAYKNAYPASLADQETLESELKELMLDQYDALTDDVKQALVNANDNGLAYLRNFLDKNKKNNGYTNGWDMNLQAFDYNNSFFEIGAISDSQYIIQDRKNAIVTRALSAVGALWGNNAYEAAYLFLWEDADGNKLIGENSYEITFLTPPPVHAFWSLTMYDLPEFFLVANEINRYSISDRTEGLKYNEDGSFTLYLSKDKPTEEHKLTNWLPAPDGQFRPIMRLYLPKEEVFQPGFSLPAIKKV